MTIGVELLQQTPGGAAQLEEKESVGTEGIFHLDDPAGPDIQFVNPKMVFYSVDISPVNTSTLVAGKDSLFSVQWGWPPVVFTSPVVQNYPLGDGVFTLTAYKGFNFDESN